MRILCSSEATEQFLEIERELHELLNGYTLRLGGNLDSR